MIGGDTNVLEDISRKEERHIVVERVEAGPKPRRAGERREAFGKIDRRGRYRGAGQRGERGAKELYVLLFFVAISCA